MLTRDVAEGPAHFLHDLHVLEGRLQRVGGCLRGAYARGGPLRDACFFSGGARRLPGPQALLLFTERFGECGGSVSRRSCSAS